MVRGLGFGLTLHLWWLRLRFTIDLTDWSSYIERGEEDGVESLVLALGPMGLLVEWNLPGSER